MAYIKSKSPPSFCITRECPKFDFVINNGAKTLNPGACDCGYKHWNNGEEYDFYFYFEPAKRGIGLYGDEEFQSFILRNKLEKYLSDPPKLQSLTRYYIIKKREYELYMNSLLMSQVNEDEEVKTKKEIYNGNVKIDSNEKVKKDDNNDDKKIDKKEKKTIKDDNNDSPVIVSLNFESKKPKKKKNKKNIKEGKKDADESNRKYIEDIDDNNVDINENNGNVTEKVTEKLSEMKISVESKQTIENNHVKESKETTNMILNNEPKANITDNKETGGSYHYQSSITSYKSSRVVVSKPIPMNEGGIKTLGDFKSEKSSKEDNEKEKLKQLQRLAQLIESVPNNRASVLKALVMGLREENEKSNNNSSFNTQNQTSYYLNDDDDDHLNLIDEEIIKKPIVLIEGKKTTQIRVKLHNNSFLNVKLHLDTRLIDLIQHIAYCTDDSTPFTLSSNISNIEFNDKMKTIEEMGIANSIVIQRLIKRNRDM